MNIKKTTGVLLCLIALLLTGLVLSGCVQKAFYYPDQKIYGGTPADDKLPFERVVFASRDGTRLTGWFIPALGGAQQATGTVIHVHGNAGNLTGHWPLVQWLPARGFNVFMFDYRGYGDSAGKPTPKGLFEDTLSAIDYVRARPDIDRERLLVFGQSLGGNNAIAAVGSGNRAGIQAVAIDSTFYSYSAIANDKLPGTGLLMNDDYSAERFIAAIAPIPLLLIHGTADSIIPYSHSERLLAKAGEPKTLILIPDGSHITAMIDGTQYRDSLVAFYEAALKSAATHMPQPMPASTSSPQP